jgi:hypothetical protein
MKPMLVQNYKTQPAMQAMRDAGVTLRYSYFDKSGGFILSIDVSPDEL